MLDSTKEFNEVKIFSAVFWYILTMFVVIFISSLLNIFTGNSDLINNDNLLSLISTTLFIIVLLYKFRVNITNLSFLFKDYINKLNLKEVIGVVATQLCLSMGISLLSIGIVYFLFPNILNDLLSQSSVSDASTYSQLFILMLVTVIGAPIMEELLFRAIIFKRLSRKVNIYISMIISSLIFGLLHIELAIIGAFLFGIACCILYIKYKNILITMTVHFFNNLLAFLPQLDINSPTTSQPITTSDAISSITFGSILLIIGITFFIKFIIDNKKHLKNGFFTRIDKPLFTDNLH